MGSQGVEDMRLTHNLRKGLRRRLLTNGGCLDMMACMSLPTNHKCYYYCYYYYYSPSLKLHYEPSPSP